jgi:hypothetical protein
MMKNNALKVNDRVVAKFNSAVKTGNALLSNVTWETLEKLDEDMAGTGARLIYLDGWLEIMTPLSHDGATCRELYASEEDSFSWTWKHDNWDGSIGRT